MRFPCLLARVFIVLILMAFIISSATPGYAVSDTIVVNAFHDEVPGTNNNACTLREAIRAINLQMSIGGCTANATTNRIVLPAGTFYLSVPGSGEDWAYSGDLDIRRSLTITGAGATRTIITVDTENTQIRDRDRIFHIKNVDAKSVIKVSFQDLTISNGYAQDKNGGGGILNENAEVTLKKVIITKNEAAKGTIGGGILNSGKMTIENSIIDSNLSTYYGGGVKNHGQMTITNSQITRNSANAGAGMDNLPDDRSTGFLHMTNVTVAENQGGGINNSGKFDGINLTIVRNKGIGLDLNGYDYLVNLRNSIIAYHGESPNCKLQYSETVFVSHGYNLIGNTKSSDSDKILCPFNHGTDIIDQDPLLSESLVSIENSFTKTYDFASPDSPAIDAIPSSDPYCPKTDQLLHLRPSPGGTGKATGCDIGAYELNGEPTEKFLYLPVLGK